MKYILATLAVSAVSVSALELFPGHQYIKRDLAARQTDGSSAEYSDYLACATALQTAYVGLPTPPAGLVSYAETATVDDPCSVTYPAAIESQVSSYVSEVEDWYSSHSAAIESALSECSEYADVGETAFDTDVCSTATDASGSGGSTEATTTADDSSATEESTETATGATTKATTTGGATTTAGAATTGSGSTGTTTASGSAATSGGKRESSGVVAAAMAVVGVLGVVAAL